jgi:hypothetical protein
MPGGACFRCVESTVGHRKGRGCGVAAEVRVALRRVDIAAPDLKTRVDWTEVKLTLILILCAAAVFAQPAPDTIKLDNDHVRVLFLTDQPRTKTPLHRHATNRVMIYLDPMQIILRYENGEEERQNWRKNQVAWSPAGKMHTGENLMDRTTRVVEVELKKPPSGKPFRTSPRDPLKVNPMNVKTEFENEHVRVLRCKYAANVSEPMHEHLSDNRISIALDDVEFTVRTQGAADRTVTLAAGQPSWSTGPVIHAAKANRAVELILIELK